MKEKELTKEWGWVSEDTVKTYIQLVPEEVAEKTRQVNPYFNEEPLTPEIILKHKISRPLKAKIKTTIIKQPEIKNSETKSLVNDYHYYSAPLPFFEVEKEVDHKARKLLSLRAEVQGEEIIDLRITGDFFVVQKEAIHQLEQLLIGSMLNENELNDKISKFYEKNILESPGILATDIVDALMKLKSLL
jgi:hypothetical protein